MTGLFYERERVVDVPGGGSVREELPEPQLRAVPLCSSWCAKRFAAGGGRVVRRDWWRA